MKRGGNDPEALVRRGLGERERGDLAAAEASFAQALKLRPGHLQARFELGQTLMRMGRFAEAIEPLAKVAQAMPTNAEVLAVHGTALARAGRSALAAPILERALALAPDHPKALANLAALRKEGGDNAAALTLYEKLAALHPGDVRALTNLAICQTDARRYEEARTTYEKALALAPDHGEAHNNLGNLLAFKGLYERAARHLERAAILRPDDPFALFNLGQAHLQARDHDKAEACHRALIARWPTAEIGYVGLSTTLQAKGAFAEALGAIERLEAATGATPSSLWLRALNGPAALDGVDLAAVRALATRRDLNGDETAKVRFVLAEALHRRGDHDDAFTAYTEANRLRDRDYAGEFDADNEHRLIAAWRALFTRDFFDHYKGAGLRDEERPVFIVGMPRSGTTLIERIIAAHPAAASAGELSTVAEIATDIAPTMTGGKPYPDCVGGLSYGHVAAVAATYMEEAIRISGADGAILRIVDKMPANFWHLGLIALMFPRARIVHCRRDPMATGFSIFRRNFTGRHDYAYDLDKIGRRINSYRAIMALWRDVLPLPILDIDYEAVVGDTEGQAARLLDFLDLPWDPAVLRLAEDGRNVHTASQWQVRQPIYGESVDGWRVYEAHLGPLKVVLEGGA